VLPNKLRGMQKKAKYVCTLVVWCSFRQNIASWKHIFQTNAKSNHINWF